MMHHRFAVLAILVSFTACSTNDEPTESSFADDARDQLAASSKADQPDDGLSSRLCEEQGVKPDCDICAVMGWYDDGICDEFCKKPDQDCASDAFVMHFVHPNNYSDGVDSLTLNVGFVPSFDAGEFASNMRKFDEETRGCAGREYSRSRQNGIELYEEFVATQNPYEGLRDWEIRWVEKSIVEEEPQAVFASVPSSPEDEGCEYYDFYAVAEDGGVNHFSFEDRSEFGDALSPDGILVPSPETVELYREMNEYGHNGASAPGVWGDFASNYEELGKFVEQADADRGCEDRLHSADSAEALDMYRSFDESEYGVESWPVDNPDGRADAALFRSAVNDTSNVAVFASHHRDDGADRPENCTYWDHYILRENGDAVRFRVDITD